MEISLQILNSEYGDYSKEVTEVIERYNSETGSTLNSFRILNPYFGVINIVAPPPSFFKTDVILMSVPMEKWISFPYTSTSVYRIAKAMKPELQKCTVDLVEYAEKTIRGRFQSIIREAKSEFEKSLKG